MQENEQMIFFKSTGKISKQSIAQTQFFNEAIDKKYVRKIPNKQIKIFNTQPTSRNNSPGRLDRKYSIKSGSNFHRKYFFKDQDQDQQKNQNQKSVNSIFKRRVNSEQKISKKKLLTSTQKIQPSGQIKLDFAKKLIQDLKRQAFKSKSRSLRYKASNIQSKSVQFSRKKSSIKQKLIQSSLQKLKPSFNVNQVKFSTAKKSSDYKESNQSKISFISRQSKNSQQLQEKISEKINRQNKEGQQLFNLVFKKSSQPINTYIQFITSSISKSDKYEIKFDFLLQYSSPVYSKNDLLLHIDLHSLKLLQSVYLCITDILTNHMSNPSQNLNFEIIREYAVVYLQMYSKIKIQFILCEVFFKTLKKKLTEFYAFQRILFYWIIQCSIKQQLDQEIVSLKKLISVLKLSQEILLTIINMFFFQTKNKGTQDSMIDTFKALRLTRQLDKRLPYIKQTFDSIISKSNYRKSTENSYFFAQIIIVFEEFITSLQKQQLFSQKIDLFTLFKLEEYYNWTNLMIPPIFFLPPLTSTSKPYTLIIDLDSTLIYYSEESRILKYRPYMDRFLTTMQKYFQLVVFSSYAKQRTDIIVKEIERDQKIFNFRLYKTHMVFQEGALRKNIGYAGRNLQKIVFIDDQQKNTKWLPSNSFQIKPFTGDKQDKQLLHLSDWLSNLMDQKPADIRGKLKKPQHFLDQITQIDEGVSTIHRSIQHQ